MQAYRQIRRAVSHFGWRTKICLFASLVVLCTIAIGIAGAAAVVFFKQSVQASLGVARLRVDVAAAAGTSVVGIDRAHARLLLARTPEALRREAVDAIRAAAYLEESLQTLEQTFPANAEVLELLALNASIATTRMEIIRSAKARDLRAAAALIASISPAIGRLEALSNAIMRSQQQFLNSSVAAMGQTADHALLVLLVSTCVSVSVVLLAGALFLSMLGKSLRKLQFSEQRMRTHNHILDLLSIGAPLPTILQAITADVEHEAGGRRCAIALGPDLVAVSGQAASPIVDSSGRLLGQIRLGPPAASAGDSTLLVRAAQLTALAIERSRINEEQRLAALVYRNSSEAMSVTDAQGTIIAINPAFVALTGFAAEEVVGRNASVLWAGMQDGIAHAELQLALDASGCWQGELWSRHKDGHSFPTQVSINSIMDDDGRVQRRVTLFADITRKKASEELIWRQANFDSLTQLPNRNMFHERLQQEMQQAHREGRQLALMFLDLDGFKDINDTQGHDMGDLLLQQVAARLQSRVRASDTVARLGGDEFTVILNGLGAELDIAPIADEIRRAIAEPFVLGSETAFLSVSIGITVFPRDGDQFDALLKNADQAMYASKAQGRNRFNFFAAAMQESVVQRMQLTNELRAAAAGSELAVYYQPIVNLASRAICKAEALLRWHSPSRGWVSPAVFIPAAEKAGLILEIGDWVFREASHQALWFRRCIHPDFQVSVNVSPVQFSADDGRLDAWLPHLQRLGMPGNAIALEITEGLLLEGSAAVTSRLAMLRAAGMAISLDDFGTGYSSLSYLNRFDIDTVKIDQSFVRELAEGNNAMALCEAIIVMAHKLGLSVVAEGIETELQRQLLLAAGCDFGQGYLFSPPLPACRFEALLQAGDRSDSAPTAISEANSEPLATT